MISGQFGFPLLKDKTFKGQNLGNINGCQQVYKHKLPLKNNKRDKIQSEKVFISNPIHVWV
jgi:hypothetical protein